MATKVCASDLRCSSHRETETILRLVERASQRNSRQCFQDPGYLDVLQYKLRNTIIQLSGRRGLQQRADTINAGEIRTVDHRSMKGAMTLSVCCSIQARSSDIETDVAGIIVGL